MSKVVQKDNTTKRTRAISHAGKPLAECDDAVKAGLSPPISSPVHRQGKRLAACTSVALRWCSLRIPETGFVGNAELQELVIRMLVIQPAT